MQAVTKGENEKRLNRLYLEFMRQIEELNRRIDELERELASRR
jgi:hypothetical protein